MKSLFSFFSTFFFLSSFTLSFGIVQRNRAAVELTGGPRKPADAIWLSPRLDARALIKLLGFYCTSLLEKQVQEAHHWSRQVSGHVKYLRLGND